MKIINVGVEKAGSLFFLLIILGIGGLGCQQRTDKSVETPLVTVGDWTLTSKELEGILPENINQDDSVALVEDYIGRWVKMRLFLHQAEINLTPSEKDIEKLLDEYKTTLLVHLYQQKMLEEKHSPMISDEEILSYYNDMKDNFKLQNNIVQGVFLKIPKEAPNQDNLRKWYKSKAPEDLMNLEAYAFQFARKYDQFIEEWVSFSRINSSFPVPISNEESFLRWRDHYETSDSLYNYYFARYNYHLMGEQAPLAYVKDRVEAILLNKKRLEFINKLGDELYEDALRDKIVKFH
ncbi:MAG TPA: hypothetical protein VJ855_01545 [Marinilabiliaceae bacterium]|nr:hypothetical protein [Marinilabiliaceae bacterium]